MNLRGLRCAAQMAMLSSMDYEPGTSHSLVVLNAPSGSLGEGLTRWLEMSLLLSLLATASSSWLGGRCRWSWHLWRRSPSRRLAEKPLDAPIEDAPIRSAPTARPVDRRWMATSGEDGPFELLLLHNIPLFEARASHDDYAASLPVYVESKSAALRLVMRTGRQVSGIVSDKKGAPQLLWSYLRGANDPRFDASDTCDESSRFTFHMVPEGSGVSLVGRLRREL